MFYVNYVIFLPLFAEINPNKVANFFILNNGEFLRHSFPPSQANSLAIFSFVEFLKGELRHISILQMASQIVFLFTSLVKIYSS